MASNPHDDSYNAHYTEHTPSRSTTPSIYPPSGTGETYTPTGYTSDQKHVERMEYNESDSYYEPSNAGPRNSEHTLIAEGFDAHKLGYSDDDLRHNYANQIVEDSAETPLVRDADQPGKVRFQDLEYADPKSDQSTPPNSKEKPLATLFSGARYSLQQRIEDKKRGIGRQKHPIVVYALTVAMLGILIYELVLNDREQGSPISLKPSINPMLGPSGSALIDLGARFPPCMKYVTSVPPSTLIGCMNNTANPVTEICTVEDLCAFGGIKNDDPNQWFRFITAIFLHAGVIHYVINMFAQLTVSAQIEREMGSGGYLITYFAAGIFGNVLGGNFALVGVPSVGASGAIFGTVAVTWVDLFAHWKYQYRPVRKLIFMTIELLVGVALGYIPYVDNFAHLGGFLMGLLVGTIFYPVISETKRHRLIVWVFRLIAIPIAVVLYVVLVRNFYKSDPYAACSWCRYLSCFPTTANNRCQGTGLTSSTTTTV